MHHDTRWIYSSFPCTREKSMKCSAREYWKRLSTKNTKRFSSRLGRISVSGYFRVNEDIFLLVYRLRNTAQLFKYIMCRGRIKVFVACCWKSRKACGVNDVPKRFVLRERYRGEAGKSEDRNAGSNERKERDKPNALSIHADVGVAPISSIFRSSPLWLSPWPLRIATAALLYFRTRLNHREGFPSASQRERIRSLSGLAHVASLLGLFCIHSIASLILFGELR